MSGCSSRGGHGSPTSSTGSARAAAGSAASGASPSPPSIALTRCSSINRRYYALLPLVSCCDHAKMTQAVYEVIVGRYACFKTYKSKLAMNSDIC